MRILRNNVTIVPSIMAMQGEVKVSRYITVACKYMVHVNCKIKLTTGRERSLRLIEL